jgi:hypothetical protein
LDDWKRLKFVLLKVKNYWMCDEKYSLEKLGKATDVIKRFI